MGRTRWIEWYASEEGKADLAERLAVREAREKEFDLNKRASIELGKLYATLNETEMTAAQKALAKKIDLTNRFTVSNFNAIAGVNLTCGKDRNGNELASCCIVVMDIRTREIIDTASASSSFTVPYIPGFLSFRGIPAILAAYEYLWCKPDLLMLGGNGYLHHLHMGLATHAAIELNTPSIGVAENYLKIDNVDYVMPKNEVGAYTDISIREEVYGRVLRTRCNVKPIFISCGNWIDLDTATEISLSMITPESRLPLPTRKAGINARALRRLILEREKNSEN